MAFILAPYNNAMRLGQGFNTYTQQICIDDAVVIDPTRAENVLANDGSTMRIMVQSMGRPSAWSRQREVVEDNAYKAVEPPVNAEDDTAASVPAAKIVEGPTPAIHGNETMDTTDAEHVPVQTEGEPAVNHDTARDDAEIPASDEKDIGSENGSGEVVIVDEGGPEADETPAVEEKQAAAVNEVESSAAPKAPEGGSDEVEPSLEAKTAAAATNTVDKPKASVSRKGAAALRSLAATKAITGSGKKSTKDGKSVKEGVDWDLYSSQDTKKVDWGSYRSQQALVETGEEEKAALLEEDRERQREERELRKERENERREEERERRRQDRELRKEIERERWEEEKKIRAEELKQRQEDAAWKREQEKARRDEQKANVDWATSTKPYSDEERAAMKKELDVAFEERFKGMLENKKDYEFDEDPTGGPSQIVTYTSRFVDKLSDITDDMNISGSLSIKAGKFGGSGRGAFINTDKFKESDLNFYISVKVVNQTINFKDALVYNPVRSVNKENFNAVFGDGFISGFQEGGEFNALVSMKILNKAKKTDIRAEAKVAFTAGPIDVKAEANVNIAKSNIETNTETTIQVSWSGGGHIKPREQQWDIQSLMQAAARFPDLVARCPQRIYAIITKYDSLRSFVKTKPAGYTKLQYENAQMYTNAMMDAYMSYKSLYTKIGSQIFDVQNKTKKITAWEETPAADGNSASSGSENTASTAVSKPAETALEDQKLKGLTIKHDTTRFLATMGGLAEAKKAIRRQMVLIVNEVDAIEQDPKKATDDDHSEPFQDPVEFEERLPKVESPEKPKSTIPLSGKRIIAKTESEDEQAQAEEDATPSSLMTDTNSLSSDEQSALDRFLAERPQLGKNLRLTPPMGSQTEGELFNNLEFLQPQWKMTKFSVEIYDGAVSALWVFYDNGLVLTRGKAKGGRVVEMTDFQTAERIVSVSIQIGKGPKKPEVHQVIAIQMHTNRGRSFIGQAATCSYDKERGHTRDGTLYTDVQTRFFDGPLQGGTVKGFYGRANDEAVWRLGFIWGDLGRDEGHDGFTDSAPASDAMDPITQAQAQSAQRQIEIDSLKNQLQDYWKEKEALNAQVQDYSRQKDTLSAQIVSLSSEANSLREHALSGPNYGDAFRRGRVEIFFILWGGMEVGDGSVASRLLDYANNNQEFDLTVDTFGSDPWYGTGKGAHIVYRYDGKGGMRCLSGKEGNRVRFDPL